MSEWKYPTLAETGVTESVRCRCTRLCRPLEMLDVRGLDASDGAPYLCNDCITDLYRQERLDCMKLHRFRGAPAAWLQWYEAKLLTSPLFTTGLPPHVWGEILARRLDRIAADAAAAAAQKATGPPVDGTARPVDGGAPTA